MEGATASPIPAAPRLRTRLHSLSPLLGSELQQQVAAEAAERRLDAMLGQPPGAGDAGGAGEGSEGQQLLLPGQLEELGSPERKKRPRQLHYGGGGGRFGGIEEDAVRLLLPALVLVLVLVLLLLLLVVLVLMLLSAVAVAG